MLQFTLMIVIVFQSSERSWKLDEKKLGAFTKKKKIPHKTFLSLHSPPSFSLDTWIMVTIVPLSHSDGTHPFFYRFSIILFRQQ
jgi:hypothetical protein